MKAAEADKAEEVFHVVFPAVDEAAEVVEPGEKALDPPAPLVASQRPSILGLAALAPVGSDHFDPVLFFKAFVEFVRVVGFVSDEPRGDFVEKASGQNVFHKLALGRRSAVDSNGERKTVISGDSDDLRPLPPAGRADGKPPFFALAKVASTNASSSRNWPRSCKCRASTPKASSSLPLRTHC